MSHKIELGARALALQLRASQTPVFRSKACLLIEAGYGTVQKLRAATDNELEGVQGIGPAMVSQLRALLAALALED